MERLTAEAVFERLEHEDAEYAAPGATGSGHCVALVFTARLVSNDSHVFFGPMVRAARAEATRRGCDVVIAPPSGDRWLETDLIERCLAHGADGLIVLGGADGNPDILRGRWPGLPVVFVEHDIIGTRSAHVGIDNEAAMSEVVVHLASVGRSRIAHITGLLDSRVGAERLAAYRRTLERLGYSVRPEYIQAGDYLLPSAYEGTKRLLALDERPDAIACACDLAAVAAIKAIHEAGLRVPEDIAVTGFDDAEWAAQLEPALTTVRQPAAEMGRIAVGSLIAMIEDPSLPPPSVMLSGELVARESSGELLPAQLSGPR
jgi:LacI family repressor for deo operon, udp, cdd, tsx, nupC, and nupG